MVGSVDDFKSGIIINVKENPDYKIRKRTKKISKCYLILALTNLTIVGFILLLMLCCKQDIEKYTAGKEGYDLMNGFFSIDSWKQWAIVIVLNVWGVFEVCLTFALKAFVKNESAKWLQAWIGVAMADCIIAGVILILILLNVATIYAIIFGIIIVLAFIYEVYILNTIFQFIRIILAQHKYNAA